MIRHARCCRLLAKLILALPIPMIESSFGTALVPPIGASALVEASLPAALRAAITMPAVAVRADEKDRVAEFPAARTLQEIGIVMGQHRRHRRLAGVDSSSPVMSG